MYIIRAFEENIEKAVLLDGRSRPTRLIQYIARVALNP